MPHHDLDRFCREIAARGPKLVVVKQGDHGATVYDREQDRLTLLDVIVHVEENVWPMVPAGGDTAEPLLEPAGVEA